MAKNIRGRKKQAATELLANAYASLAHTEYNLTGHADSEPLVDFRAALSLLEIDINPYLPPECPKV